MPNIDNNNTTEKSAFVSDDNIYGKKAKIKPAPEKQIGIDTNDEMYQTLIDAAMNNVLNMSAFTSFNTTAQSREQMYSLIDAMSEDPIIAAILETYAEDATVPNEEGNIVWAESDTPDIAKCVNYLLQSMKANKHVYSWVYNLCKYGDIYLRLYRKSEFDQVDLFDDTTSTNDKKTKLNEDISELDKAGELDEKYQKMTQNEVITEAVKIKAYSKEDHFVPYIEIEPNPSEMFELTKFGKTYAYVKADVSTTLSQNTNWYQGNDFLRYKFNKNDVSIYQATEYVHGYFSDNQSRTPEEIELTISNTSDDAETSTKARYKVRRGQSMLYDAFKIWRELTLLENSVLLNRVTRSSIVRIIGVEVGDMPKHMVQPHLQGIKRLIEQKSALDAGNSLNEYTNPGPVENNIYIPTHDGDGAITVQTLGGDVNVGQLTDIDHFRDKLFGSFSVPKQYFGYTEDGAGFNGGQSLTIISSRYAKRVIRIQNTIIQTLTDAINIQLLDKGMSNYINKFKIKMMPPVTQDDIDRRANLSEKIQSASDIMNLLTEIEDTATKLKILKQLLSGFITDPTVIELIQAEIDKLEQENQSQEEDNIDDIVDMEQDEITEPTEARPSVDIDLDRELGLSEPTGEEESEQETETSTTETETSPQEPLPTPASLGLDFTNSNSAEFQ